MSEPARYDVPDEEFKEARALEHMLDQLDLAKPCLLVISLPDLTDLRTRELTRQITTYVRGELMRIGVFDHVGLLVIPDSIRTTLHVLKKD